jgi:hypothetical protein
MIPSPTLSETQTAEVLFTMLSGLKLRYVMVLIGSDEFEPYLMKEPTNNLGFPVLAAPVSASYGGWNTKKPEMPLPWELAVEQLAKINMEEAE